MAAAKWEKTRTTGVYVRKDGADRPRYRAVVWTKDPDSDRPRRKQVAKTFDLLADAKTWREDMGGSTPIAPPSRAGKMTLQELRDSWYLVKTSYSLSTLSLHETIWRQAALASLKGRAIRDIDSTDIDRALGKITAPAMLVKTRSLLSTLFNHAVSTNRITANPVSKPARSTTRAERMAETTTVMKPTLNDRELSLLVDEMPDRYRALIELMAYQGLRPGEAYALRVGSFDPLRRTLEVTTSTTGYTKTGEHRTLTLPAVVAEFLVTHVARFSAPADPTALIFPRPDGGMIDAHNFRDRVWQPARSRAGLHASITPNQLRHTAAARAIGHGADVYSVQRMLGHARPSITLDTYGYLWSDSAERLADTLDDVIREARSVPAVGGHLVVG